ncbi:MAG: GNAT family N-acetyltransferase [Anaerolineales bacterium]
MPIDLSGPSGASLHVVNGTSPDLLRSACEIFEQVFPEDRRYLPYLRACAQGNHPSHPNTYDHVWLVSLNGEWVGVRIFSYIKTRSFGHGAYIGFTPQARGNGLGTWLVEQTLRQLDDDAKKFGRERSLGYLVEVERPIDAETEEQRLEDEKRLQFHRQCGAIILPVPFVEPVMIEDVDYITMEELEGEKPRPMHLALIPTEYGQTLPHLDIADLVQGLYCDVYRLPRQHIFVKSALSHLFK